MTTVALPEPAYRAVPSQFPPISAFESVTSSDDLAAAMELEGWTNDRLVAERLARLPRHEWVFGVPNASVVMSSFLHAALTGQRFTGPHPELGAWYAAMAINTALAEVSHHLRREAFNTGMPEMRGKYRMYSCSLSGAYKDIRGRGAECPGLYHAADYSASQAFGEALRPHGDGIVYDSLRHVGGTNVVAYRTHNVGAVTQLYHYELTVPATGKIVIRRL